MIMITFKFHKLKDDLPIIKKRKTQKLKYSLTKKVRKMSNP